MSFNFPKERGPDPTDLPSRSAHVLSLNEQITCFDADLPRPPGGNCAALVPCPGALGVIGTCRQ